MLSAIRDVIGSYPVLVHVYRPDVVSQAVSFWRAVQTRVWRGRPDPTRDSRAEYHAAAIAHVVTLMREQEKGWRAWFDEENIEPIEISYPVLWRNLTKYVATVLEALDEHRNVVAKTETFNESAEALAVPDLNPEELLKSGKVKPLPADAEERFRGSFLKEETPPFTDYRVKVIETPEATPRSPSE